MAVDFFVLAPGLRAASALIFLVLFPTSGAHADDVVGNLAAANSGANAVSATTWLAEAFTMGTQSYQLSDVQILANVPVGSSVVPEVQLESDSGGLPSGTALFTFDNPASFNEVGVQTYTFTAGSTFTLNANTTYWLVGRQPPNNLGENWAWEYAEGVPPASGAGATGGQSYLTSNSGANWGVVIGSKGLIYEQYQVDGTPSVPEPSNLMLLVMGTTAAAVGWRGRLSRTI